MIVSYSVPYREVLFHTWCHEKLQMNLFEGREKREDGKRRREKHLILQVKSVDYGIYIACSYMFVAPFTA